MSGSAPLRGRAIVVTGGGSGLGEAYVRYLAAHGALLLIGGRNEAVLRDVASEIRDAGGVAVAVRADVRVPEDAEALVADCIREFGRIDGLVNNAGMEITGRAWEADADDMRMCVETNVLGTMYTGAAAMRAMVRQGSGSIVNTTSGAFMGLARMSVYGATKGAVASLTHCWALDLADTGVRCNAISPLGVTHMYRENAESEGLSGTELEAKLASVPTPEANAPLVAYLLSDLSSGINGQIFRNDGDGIAIVSHPALFPSSGPLTGDGPSDAAAAVERILHGVQPLGLKRSAVAATSVVKSGL